jgi:glycoprotease/Kae1 family metallohydrolase
MLVRVRGCGEYELLGRTRDDAAGEAFDKVAKMLGLPYPGGPEMDRLAVQGDPAAFDFPRSFMVRESLEFSFSGLKTAVLYELPRLDLSQPQVLADVCASVQQAIVEVLVEKLVRAARRHGETLVAVSGGVSCNRGLRKGLGGALRSRGTGAFAGAACPVHRQCSNDSLCCGTAFQRRKGQCVRNGSGPQFVSGLGVRWLAALPVEGGLRGNSVGDQFVAGE